MVSEPYEHGREGHGAHGDGRGGGHGGGRGGGHGGSHGGGHGGGHGHGRSSDLDRRHLTLALALILGYMAGELVVGLVAHSLALISDAGHMLTDAAAIVLALIAMRLAAKPPRGGYTYGLKRTEIMSALINGVTLLLLSVYFVYEGISRLLDPPQVAGGPVLITGLAGIVVNLTATWLISGADRSSLNVEGAYRHILGDLLAFIATSIAGAVVLLTGWARADAVAALIVAVLMLHAGYRLVGGAGRVFMEAAPAGMNPAAIGAIMARRPGVVEVHDLHIWEVTSGYPALSAHILVVAGGDCHDVRRDLERVLRTHYEIDHTTLQVDHVPPAVLTIGSIESIGSEARAGEHCADPHGPAHRSG